MWRSYSTIFLLLILGFLGGCNSAKTPKPEVTVTGRILDRDYRPLGNKVVSFNSREPDQKDNATGTDTKGQFTIKLVPGKYHVTVAELAHGSAGAAELVGGQVGTPKAGVMPTIPSAYRNANETPWQIEVLAEGTQNIQLVIGR